MVRHDTECEHREMVFFSSEFKRTHQLHDIFFRLKDILSIISAHDYMEISVRMPVSFSSWHINDHP